MEWYWISLSYATFGICANAGVVVRTAPIGKWCRGKKLSLVLDYYRRKKADIRRLTDD